MGGSIYSIKMGGSIYSLLDLFSARFILDLKWVARFISRGQYLLECGNTPSIAQSD